MGRYVARRLLVSIPVLFLVTVVIFTMVELAPGDMADFFITDDTAANMTEADMEALRERLGLNDPAPIRYFTWLGRVLVGDLGFSFIQAEPVSDILLRRAGNSLLLMGAGIGIAIVVGISLGVVAALRQYSITDFTISGLSFVGISMPAFISGIFGLYIFSVLLGWFPAGGMRTPGVESVWDVAHHLVLPAVILSILQMAAFMRFTRFSMLEVLKQDYVVTAIAKGMRRHVVVMRHAFRNALIPVITVVGLSVREVVVGAVFLETIFSWPGMGTLYFNAIVSRDFPIIMGANLLIAILVLVANLITDLSYAATDPRIRLE